MFIEGVISGLDKARKVYKDTNLFYKYDTLIFKQSKTLSNLTGGLEPDKLLEEFIGLIDQSFLIKNGFINNFKLTKFKHQSKSHCIRFMQRVVTVKYFNLG